ncbi:MAG TPA: DUF2877 domain-containing protein [Nakamurella sp.]|nr:DUF2877 domain-containing protein [Nakamurella sp.]
MVRAQVIAAAAGPVLPWVHGPVRAGTVLGGFSRAVIIGVPTPAGRRVLSLLAPAASGVPNGVRLTAADATVLARQPPGEAASVGGDRILLGDLEVRVVRSWPCRVRRVAVKHRSIDTITLVAQSRPAGVPAVFVAALESALESVGAAPVTTTSAAHGPLRDAARRLVGRGLGLTPGGDDVIAGALCGLHATGATRRARALAAVALDDVTDRTTLLSADLLRLAAQGDACLEILGVLRTMHRVRDRPGVAESALDRSALDGALDRLLAVGHTSGADLATGLAVGLRVGATAGIRERSEVG